jgi:hypothetical protein
MLNKVMVPADDPRIPLMFDKGSHREGTLLIPNPEYKALPMNLPQGLQSDSITFFASWDSTAYRLNIRLPGIYIAAPEVNFLKAEAFERWGLTGGTAQASYELALRQAVAFQYYLYNNAATKYEALVQPSTAAVTAFLAKPGVNYAGDSPTRLAMIWTQKWLFFNILQSRQAWAEYRRTGYPQLTFMNSGTPEYELPPNRLIYPASEIAYNSSYEKVRAKDTREEKIFWAKIE